MTTAAVPQANVSVIEPDRQPSRQPSTERRTWRTVKPSRAAGTSISIDARNSSSGNPSLKQTPAAATAFTGPQADPPASAAITLLLSARG